MKYGYDPLPKDTTLKANYRGHSNCEGRDRGYSITAYAPYVFFKLRQKFCINENIFRKHVCDHPLESLGAMGASGSKMWRTRVEVPVQLGEYGEISTGLADK